ncbi:MAG: hypothetical protein RR313_11200 [Anaerovoracaceae bacterium]
MRMLENMNVYQKILEQLVLNYNETLAQQPNIQIIKKTVRSKKYTYLVDENGKKININNGSDLVEQYEFRQSLVKIRDILTEDIKAVKNFKKEYVPIRRRGETQLPKASGGNKIYDDNLIHEVNGEKYRSKSEVIIAMILTAHKLEFVYECCIEKDGKKLFPDFAVKRPRDGRIIYMEHFGLIGNEDYNGKVAYKIEEYRKSNITLWDNLILTFDGVDGSIDVANLERVIKLFLL